MAADPDQENESRPHPCLPNDLEFSGEHPPEASEGGDQPLQRRVGRHHGISFGSRSRIAVSVAELCHAARATSTKFLLRRISRSKASANLTTLASSVSQFSNTPAP